MEWKKLAYSDGRVEWQCEHGIRHSSSGSHTCDKCCTRADFPGKVRISLRKDRNEMGEEQKGKRPD